MIVVTSTEASDVPELLRRAESKMEREDYAGALADYRLVLSSTEPGEEHQAARLGEATALDLSGDPGAALSAYQGYLSAAPKEEDQRAIEVRVIRLLVYLEDYDEAEMRASRVDLEGLTPLQQIALFSAKSLGALERQKVSEAEKYVSRGRSLIDAHSLDRAAVPPLDVAAVFFALGEIHRQRANDIGFVPLPVPFAPALEARCQHILDAQSAYSTVMRSQDAHWSSMAGVRVGHLYQHLHEDLMEMPVPVEADTPERRQLFEGAIRLRYSILLRKSLAMMKSTVSLLERTKHTGDWAEKARKSLQEIEAAEIREQAAIDALPYTREHLQKALDDLMAQAQAAGS